MTRFSQLVLTAIIICAAVSCKKQPASDSTPASAPASRPIRFESIDLVLSENQVRGGVGYVLQRVKADNRLYLRIDQDAKEDVNLYSVSTTIPIRQNDRLHIAYEYKPLAKFSGLVSVDLLAPDGPASEARFHRIVPAGAKEPQLLPDGWMRVEETIVVDQPVRDIRVIFPRIFQFRGTVLIRGIDFSVEKP